jgi:two-component system, cell cycle response regulator
VSDHEETGTLVIQSPAVGGGSEPEGEACLILIHPPGPNLGRRTPLPKPPYVVGRDREADLLIGRDSVSRRHAQIVRSADGRWAVRDLGSTNGTFVNEGRIDRVDLRDGDQIRFGDTIFKFLSGENIEAAYHEEIYRMTIADGLTGVANKRYFLEFLERELAAAHRHGTPLTLVFFDIDHFKPINDDRGHLCGDEVLKELAARVRQRIRREDLFARFGGEEFACILTRTGITGGVKFAEAIRRLIASRPFEFEGESFPVTVSVGVAQVDHEPDATSDELLRRADENLYEAKRSGRNRVIPDPAAFG